MSHDVRSIAGFPGYFASADGFVWSNKYGDLRRLRGRPDKDGYLQVDLWRDKKPHTRKVHHLVLEAFVGPCPAGCLARHLDDVPANNRAENLRWGTPIENAADRERNGNGNRGSRHGLAKLSEDDVREIRRAYSRGERRSEIAKRFPMVKPNHLWAVAHRPERWAHVSSEVA